MSQRSRALGWIALAAALLVISAVWIQATATRPTYDAFGWLAWGHQVLHWNLNTDGAPSWKPLVILFTAPFRLPGAQAELWLWTFTATFAALLGAVLAGRIAYRLAGPSARRPWAGWAAATFAAIGVLGINGYVELILITNSDPMIMTLCLGAIDSHLCGRRRLAFLLLLGASLGRPEAWVFAGLYGAWVWSSDPVLRPLVAGGVLLIPLAWFGVPALTSHSWFISGDLALGSPNVIHGGKFLGVLDRLRHLYGVPQQLAIAFALALALAHRRRVWLTLAGAALLWVAIEIAFAYHGWSAVPRYLLEPGAVLIVLAGAALGEVAAYEGREAGGASLSDKPSRRGLGALIAWGPAAIVLVLLIALVPTARTRARLAHAQIDDARIAATRLNRLQSDIKRVGGAARIRACGQPAGPLVYQSELAWALGVNVGQVSWHPAQLRAERLPLVQFTAIAGGWRIQAMNVRAVESAHCAGLVMGSS